MSRGPGYGAAYYVPPGLCMAMECRDYRLAGSAYCNYHDEDVSELTHEFKGILIMQDRENFKEMMKETSAKKVKPASSKKTTTTKKSATKKKDAK